jgi:hypothetical protein
MGRSYRDLGDENVYEDKNGRLRNGIGACVSPGIWSEGSTRRLAGHVAETEPCEDHVSAGDPSGPETVDDGTEGLNTVLGPKLECGFRMNN